MRAGRIALVAAVLLGAVALLSATSGERRVVAPPPARAVPPAPAVEAELPADGEVRADVGDVLRLRVRTSAPDVAEAPRLALRWPVGPRSTGEVVFVARREGRFAVRLRRDGRRLGVLAVGG